MSDSPPSKTIKERKILISNSETEKTTQFTTESDEKDAKISKHRGMDHTVEK